MNTENQNQEQIELELEIPVQATEEKRDVAVEVTGFQLELFKGL
jgi:hypothetical protein